MKKILFVFLNLLALHCLASEGPTLSGKLLVDPGAVETYSVSWEIWDNTYEWYANVNWDVAHGTVISSDKHSITIQSRNYGLGTP